MDILFLLVPLSLALVALVVWALLWAVRSGQFEDLRGPAERILMDDDGPRDPRRGRRPAREHGPGVDRPPPEP